MIQPSGHANAPFRSFFHWKASSVTRLLHEDVGSTHATFKRRKTCKNQNAVQWTLRRIGRINTRHCSSEEMPTRIQPLSSENCAESRLPYLRRKNKQEPSHNLSNDGPYLQRQLASAGFCPFLLKTLSNSLNLSIMQAFGNGMAHLNRIGLRHPGQPLATVITSAHL